MSQWDSKRVVHPLFQENNEPQAPTSPLQIEVKVCSVKLACDLNHLFHSKLPKVVRGNIDRNKYKICFAFLYENKYYGTAIWSSPVARMLPENYLELRRLALANDCPKNTASRVISIMQKKIKLDMPYIVKLVSYQDAESHLGTIYKASNWIVDGDVRGNRDWSDSRKRSNSQTKSNKIRWAYHL